MRPTVLWCAISAISVIAASGALRATAADRPAGRLIVKLRPAEACPGCSAAETARSRADPGAQSLRELESRLDVRGMRRLFPSGLGDARTPAPDRLAKARSRLARRAVRMPANEPAPDLAGVFVVELPPGADVERAVAEYAASSAVEWAEPDRLVRADLTPGDPLYPQQWGPVLIGAPLAWDVASGAGTVIAIVDTSVDAGHADLAANLWSNPGEIAGNGIDDDGNGFVDDLVGWDFVAGDATPEDRHGHGTHVAGIAAATAGNATGIAGIAFDARVMAVKGLGDDGYGWVSDLAAAMVYAAENGADVINDSWGGSGIDQVLVDAVGVARALGVVVVAAAGNEASSTDTREPAGIPGVIAVGASSQSDAIAGFSNFGDALSVAAPGVSVLSLRAANATGLGSAGIVQPGYQLLSGTSMAAPHVAGLAAVVLSQAPALGPDQVRWQLELNADQPGYPGYEGEAWNPYFGWGRIDAARAFDPVAVTTRIRPPPNVFHGIAGALTPSVASLGIAFTTLDPVPWTVAAPSWLAPSPAAGSGDDTISLGFDATALLAGSVTGTVEVAAPSAIDGGASLPMTAHVHSDVRAGEASVLTTGAYPLQGLPVVATDGVGSVVVWDDASTPAILLAHLDGAGQPGPPAAIAEGWPPKLAPAVAFDGRSYLVVWFEVEELPNGWLSSIRAMRVAADGTPIDRTPFPIAERKGPITDVLRDPRVAFDGQAYTILWEDWRGRIGETRVPARRVGADGTLHGRRAVQVYPDKGHREHGHVEPAIGCAGGRCLVAWAEFDGETAPDGHYVDKGYGSILVGGAPVSKVAARIMNDAQVVRAVATDGADFVVSAYTRTPCPASGKLQDVPVATRVTAAGVSLDPDPIRLDASTPDCPQSLPWDIAFDGTDYVVPFAVLAPKPAGLLYGYYLFAARLSRAGVVLDDEVEGLLLHEEPRALRASLAATRMESVLAWSERSVDYRDTVKVRRVLRRASAPGYPEAVIGSIGPLVVAEGQPLLRTIAPPAGFDPGTTALTATGLPPGAVFDAPTGAFRWQPDGTEAGLHSGLTFAATSGSQTTAETVSIVVTEALRSLSGRVVLTDGTAVTDVGVQIGGVPGDKPIAFTDRDGRYRLTGLAPRLYSATLDRASKKRYRMLGRTERVAVLGGDVAVPDIVVAPK
jgi:Subtilase family/Putative Ig domain